MAFGIQTWAANGTPNNYGLVPVTVAGYFSVGLNQQSGAVSYPVPPGFALYVMPVCASNVYTTARRRFTITGGTISISAAAENDFGAGTYPAYEGFVIAYLRAA